MRANESREPQLQEKTARCGRPGGEAGELCEPRYAKGLDAPAIAKPTSVDITAS